MEEAIKDFKDVKTEFDSMFYDSYQFKQLRNKYDYEDIRKAKCKLTRSYII